MGEGVKGPSLSHSRRSCRSFFFSCVRWMDGRVNNLGTPATPAEIKCSSSLCVLLSRNAKEASTRELGEYMHRLDINVP